MIPLPFLVKDDRDGRGGNSVLLAKSVMSLLDSFYFSGKWREGSMAVKRHKV